MEDTSKNFLVLSDIIDNSFENFLGKILISNKSFLDLKHLIHNFVPNSDKLEYPCLINHNIGKNRKDQLDTFKSYPQEEVNGISKLNINPLDEYCISKESSDKMELKFLGLKVLL